MSQSPTETPAPQASPLLTHRQRWRILLVGGSALCVALVLWLGRWLGLPVHADYEASLLQQPNVVAAVLVAGLALLLSVVLGTLIAAPIRFDGGLLIGVVGLAGLSLRGGTMRDVILWSGRLPGTTPCPQIFGLLMLETLLLFALVGGVWLIIWHLYQRDLLRGRVQPYSDLPRVSAARTAAAIGLQTAVAAVVTLLVGQSEQKAQAMVAAGIGAFFGAGAAEFYFRNARIARWYWVGPAAVALLGYALAWINPAGLATADLHGWTASLARPLPLDYASIGAAGALLGHWSGAPVVKAISDLVNEGLAMITGGQRPGAKR